MNMLTRQNTAIADVASLDAQSWSIVWTAVSRAEPVYTNTRSGWSSMCR